ncbi:putative ADP-ribosylation factor GTPase-activating protein AGD14 [Dichanthelium oligosanthes]|uniref:Putative ADP-ribosylation factor GTPase-activating protein AGD14 n=1 Tax=Dichanthelium oligosanthes TaxID=888268 RepID=A0A1E5V4Y9_9POAL|nr:putative ADP-ribosylation factor GTPase-activating protein AGD14 [Dichanthelium oligosanthes]
MRSRVKEEERNEKIIRSLLKLPGNRRCINCNSLGPQYVCTTFSTFICTNCSGIHREFSHRVKSISMAKFTSQEVSALQEGGNERAKEIYFKHWDFQGPDIDNSDVDILRTFIKNVYVERRYADQRIGEHLPQAKGNQDSNGNSNAYVRTYEDNHDLKHSIESLSEDRNNSNGHPVGGTVDQNNSSTMASEKANFRSHLHRDDLLKTDGKSENNQKVLIAAASNSNKAILAIKLPDAPRSQKATASNTSTDAQKSTSSRTDDPSPATLRDAKLYVPKNLIDFDSDMEPSQGVAQIDIRKDSLPPTDVGWATFDVVTPKKTTNMPSTSSTNYVEVPMLRNPDLASASQIRFPNAKSLSISLVTHGSQQHQHYFSPANTIQSDNTPLNRTASAPVNSQLWRAASSTPTTQGGSILPANQGSNILIGTHNPAMQLASQQSAAEVTSNGRKALPEDIFTMSYGPVPSAWNWQPNPRVNVQYGQYGTHYPVGIVNVRAFPSLTSMQEALPNMGSTALLSHAPGMGSVGSVLPPPQVPLLPLTGNNEYMVRQHAVQVQNNTFPTGYEGIRGIATTATAYGLPLMDQRLAAQNLQAMNHNSLPRVGGNPFA